MKRLLAITIIATCAVAAFAAPVKKSKAVPLNDSQMESVKGQGTITGWVWVNYQGVWVPDTSGGGYWQAYTYENQYTHEIVNSNRWVATNGNGHYEGGYWRYVWSFTSDTGQYGPTFNLMTYGPLAGQHWDTPPYGYM